jgi:hypothetical protein
MIQGILIFAGALVGSLGTSLLTLVTMGVPLDPNSVAVVAGATCFVAGLTIAALGMAR